MRAISLGGDAIQPEPELEPEPPQPSAPAAVRPAMPWLCSGSVVAGAIPPPPQWDDGYVLVEVTPVYAGDEQ